jgi:hypothetical protein
LQTPSSTDLSPTVPVRSRRFIAYNGEK